MRGRGLKHGRQNKSGVNSVSPPMRGRGLKQANNIIFDCTGRSPPMRGRGLKRQLNRSQQKQHYVAPHAGAWIETI